MSQQPTNGADLPVKVPMTVDALLRGQVKKDEIAKVMGNAASGERLIKMFAIASSRSPKLLQCTPISVLDAMVRCAELKLIPGTLGSIYLIPFFNGKTKKMECQTIIGYRGLVELARRSGQISTIASEVVRKGDIFEFEHGMEDKFRHVPQAPEDALKTHVWARARFTDGSYQMVVMTAAQVDKVRKMSKASGSGPWVDHPEEMWKKTAVRRLCKMLPLTIEVEAAIAEVDRSEVSLADLGIATDDDEGGGESDLASRLKNKVGDPPEGEQTPQEPPGTQQTASASTQPPEPKSEEAGGSGQGVDGRSNVRVRTSPKN